MYTAHDRAYYLLADAHYNEYRRMYVALREKHGNLAYYYPRKTIWLALREMYPDEFLKFKAKAIAQGYPRSYRIGR